MSRLVLVLWLANAAAHGAEVTLDSRVAPEWRHENSNGPFDLPDTYENVESYSSRQALDLRYKNGGLNAQLAAHWDVHEHDAPRYEAVANELYVDAPWRSHYFSLGQKVSSWGVGYGFRPIDVVQRENRRAIYTAPQKGVPMLGWETFTGDTAFSAIYANPLRGEAGDPSDDEALVARRYRRLETADVHAVARLSRRNQMEFGGAFSHVVGNALEWHGEWLHQRRFFRRINSLTTQTGATLATEDPNVLRVDGHGNKIMLGAAWTHGSGLSLLAEAWYDAEAYSARQWRDLVALVERQRALLAEPVSPAAIYGNIAWSMRYFESPNLLRRNILLRVSHTGTRWTPALDVLHTPEDGGVVTTAGLRYAGDRQEIEAGLRAFGGPRDAAYRLLPEDRVAYFVWQRSFQ